MATIYHISFIMIPESNVDNKKIKYTGTLV